MKISEKGNYSTLKYCILIEYGKFEQIRAQCYTVEYNSTWKIFIVIDPRKTFKY